MAERRHRLTGLGPPVDPAPTRTAADADRALLWAWLREFHHEATPTTRSPGVVDLVDVRLSSTSG
jgi:hypothetical protein